LPVLLLNLCRGATARLSIFADHLLQLIENFVYLLDIFVKCRLKYAAKPLQRKSGPT